MKHTLSKLLLGAGFLTVLGAGHADDFQKCQSQMPDNLNSQCNYQCTSNACKYAFYLKNAENSTYASTKTIYWACPANSKPSRVEITWPQKFNPKTANCETVLNGKLPRTICTNHDYSTDEHSFTLQLTCS